MLSSFGTTISTISLLLSLSLLYLSYYDLKLSNNKISKKIYKFSFSQILFTFFSFITLIVVYVISDFSLINVYENSHTTKPLFYKISGTWESRCSLLLWINILVLFSFLFLILNKNKTKFCFTLLFSKFINFSFLNFFVNKFKSFFIIISNSN